MTIHERLKANLDKQPHSILTLILLAAAAVIVLVALLPDHWVLKVIVALYILLP